MSLRYKCMPRRAICILQLPLLLNLFVLQWMILLLLQAVISAKKRLQSHWKGLIAVIETNRLHQICTLQVKQYVNPWPCAQWGDEKDLSTICVMASSRNQVTTVTPTINCKICCAFVQVRELRNLLKQKRFEKIKGVQALATYELQGKSKILQYITQYIQTLFFVHPM